MRYSTLQQLIQDYNDGIITLEKLQLRLKDDVRYEDRSFYQKNYQVPYKVAPIIDDYIQRPTEPEWTLLEKERIKEIISKLKSFRAELTDKQWETLILLSKGMTQVQIGEETECSQQMVNKRIKAIQKLGDKFGLRELMQQAPYDTFPQFAPGTPNRYRKKYIPTDIKDHVDEVSNTISKVKLTMDTAKKQKIHSHYRCRMPEYIKYSCGFDDTVCCLCDWKNCIRKNSNPLT